MVILHHFGIDKKYTTISKYLQTEAYSYTNTTFDKTITFNTSNNIVVIRKMHLKYIITCIILLTHPTIDLSK